MRFRCDGSILCDDDDVPEERFWRCFFPRKTRTRGLSRGFEGGFEREKCAFARNAERICARGWERARFFTKGPLAFVLAFFPFNRRRRGVVFLSEILRRRRPLPRRRCVSRSYEMKKDSRFCPFLFCHPNRQPIRSVQNHQRHGRDHDSSRQESPEAEPPS